MMRSSITLWLIALSLLCFSCKRSTIPAEGAYPPAGAQLSAEELADLTFRWQQPEQRQAAVQDPVFRLYRLTEVKKNGDQPVYHFELVQRTAVADQQSVALSNDNRQRMRADQLYFWEVVGKDENGMDVPLQKRSVFSSGRAAVSSEELSAFFATDCQNCNFVPDSCITLSCTACQDQGTHIATKESFDITGGDGLKLTDESGSAATNSPCIRTFDNQIHFTGRFNVNVPFDKIDSVETVFINAFLFKGDVSAEDSITLKNFTVNDEETGEILTITKEDYYVICQDSALAAYQARVEMNMEFTIEGDPSDPPYTVVFYLPMDAPHTHAPPAVDAQTQQQNRMQQLSIAHTHEQLNTPDCPSDNSLLSYYTCRDTLYDEHISQHIVVLELPVCE